MNTLTFTVKIPEYDVRETTYEWQSFHWSDEHKYIFRNRLNENRSTFAEHITNSDANTCTQERINELTANVTNRINSAAGNLFTKIHKTSLIPKFSQISKSKQDRKIWYDDQCKAKKSLVKAAVRAYNSEHTEKIGNLFLKPEKTINIFVEKRNCNFREKDADRWTK